VGGILLRNKFNEEMAVLNKSLIEMGELIESAISVAVKALTEQDVELAKRAIEYDDEIDAKENEIESQCLKLILRQQPVAGDLRLISAAMKMITDMERIGDQSADISELTIMMADRPYIKRLDHISQMAEASIKMVNESIEAFVNRDIKQAIGVIDYDDVVDDLFIEIRTDLIRLIEKNVGNCEQAFDLMMIAKYFERIADHATNIAEWVVYSITGSRDYTSVQ
jgi:phosphate transport system protein